MRFHTRFWTTNIFPFHPSPNAPRSTSLNHWDHKCIVYTFAFDIENTNSKRSCPLHGHVIELYLKIIHETELFTYEIYPSFSIYYSTIVTLRYSEVLKQVRNGSPNVTFLSNYLGMQPTYFGRCLLCIDLDS